MNVGLVRKIDYWLGIPLCFFLTGVNFVLKPFRRKPLNQPKKFLFVELSEMGSAVLAYSAIKYLKTKYPGAEIFFAIFEKNRSSVDALGMIKPENVLSISERSLFKFASDFLKCVLRLWREKIDAACDLELFARSTAVLTYLSGAPQRVGFYKYNMEGLYRGNLLTHRIQYNFQQHISKSFLTFVKVLEYQAKNFPMIGSSIKDEEIETPRYFSTKETKENIWRKLKQACPQISEVNRLIILNPSAGVIPIRAWPLPNYITLAKKLLADPANCVILIGTPKDWEINEQVCRALESQSCVNFAGQTSFLELMDLFSIAQILVTNDSGPAQFAVMADIKNFVFFGPETPNLYSPLGKNTKIIYSNFSCSPCLTAFNHRNTSCRDNQCLKAISPEEVYKMIIQ